MKILKLLKDGLAISFFPKRIVKILYKPYSFAWLVHSRDIQDFYRRFPMAKILPQKTIEFLCKILWPIIVSDITGVRDKEGKEKIGCILGIPLLSQQIFSNQTLTEKKIMQALKLAEKIGVQNVALAANNASVTKGGETVYRKTSVFLTNNYALLSATAFREIEEIIKLYNNTKSFNLQFGIVGATTIPGKVISKLLAKREPKKIILIGKTQEHLEVLKQECLKINNEIEIETSIDVRDINNCDFVIISTNSPSVVISPEYIKNNSIVFDITQPPNPSIRYLKLRKNIKVFDGLVINTPGINYHFNFGLPLEHAYPCLAEVILLAKKNKKGHFGVGDISLEQVEEIISLAKKYNFNPVMFDRIITWK